MKKSIYLGLFALFLLAACSKQIIPTATVDTMTFPAAPDYTKLMHWAAHPDKTDEADKMPTKGLFQDTLADVFFVYPTIYDGTEKGQDQWNADVNDMALNKKIDESTILNQASIFNAVGRVFSPRYRQAHYHVYFEKENLAAGKKAFEVAYQDVKTAFEYYLKHENNGRAIVIASHSQGTNHATRLLEEFFDNDKELKNKLVAAYLVGMPLPRDTFKTIPACETPKQIGCFCSWNTYAKDYYPATHKNLLYRSLATNPLSWINDGSYISNEKNIGGVGLGFKVKPEFSDAQSVEGMIWIAKPNVWYAKLLNTKRWHYADYNLFYMNVRANVIERAKEYWAF